MICRDWEERLALAAGGDLDATEAAEVERHLSGCEGCREAAEEFRRAMDWAREAHEEPVAPGHYTAVRAAVLERVRREKRPAWMKALVCGLTVAAVAMVFLVLPKRVETPVAPPQVALARPPAPEVELQRAPSARRQAKAPAPRPALRPAALERPAPEASDEPLVVKLLTDDPNVIIYWISERKGE